MHANLSGRALFRVAVMWTGQGKLVVCFRSAARVYEILHMQRAVLHSTTVSE